MNSEPNSDSNVIRDHDDALSEPSSDNASSIDFVDREDLPELRTEQEIRESSPEPLPQKSYSTSRSPVMYNIVRLIKIYMPLSSEEYYEVMADAVYKYRRYNTEPPESIRLEFHRLIDELKRGQVYHNI